LGLLNVNVRILVLVYKRILIIVPQDVFLGVIMCYDYKCRLKYSTCINSIFAFCPYIKIPIIYEIINCFISLDFNAVRDIKYLKENTDISISKTTLHKIYIKLRDILYKYSFIVYDSEALGELNKGDYFSFEESLINLINNMNVWVIGLLNNTTKDFIIQSTFNRDANTLFYKICIDRESY